MPYKNKEAKAEAQRRWRAKWYPENKKRESQRSKDFYHNLSEQERRRRTMWRDHKITPERFDELFEEQGGCCAACGEPFIEETPDIDHDHKCCPGKQSCGQCVRGLLHSSCNKALGLLQDRPDFCINAAEYLKRRMHGGNQQLMCTSVD